MNGAVRNRGGFTLIELLVVVAIIGLLISILLPALSRAREQAKVTVCTSNLRQIALAMASYRNENADLPWALPSPYPDAPFSFSLYTEFIWGGGMPSKGPTDWPYGGRAPTGSDVWTVPPRFRPMNKFISSSVSWDSGDRDTQIRRRQVPMDLPGTFKCPSDASAFVPTAEVPNPPTETQTIDKTWEFWGTSYAINWYWPNYYRSIPMGQSPPYAGDFINILGGNRAVPGLGTAMLRQKDGRFSSEFIVFYENAMNYPFANAYPRGFSNPNGKNVVGWHKQKDMHAASFLDGSARYQKFDTRYVDGAGWTTWPTKPWEGTWAQYNDD